MAAAVIWRGAGQPLEYAEVWGRLAVLQTKARANMVHLEQESDFQVEIFVAGLY